MIEAASSGAKPLLIGHSPAFHIAHRQKDLLDPLRSKLKSWHFPYLSFAVHRRTNEDPKDYSQRTRAFLYATIGAVIADKLGLREATIADNGVVSLNLPINDQLLGARASRSTHPRFLRMFTELGAQVFHKPPQLKNPLWSRTRTEVIEVLKGADAQDLVEATRSCSRPRNLARLQPQCGVCSQCIDRRFATLAAGLEEHDPGERYRLDIFRQGLPDGEARTMALSYVRFAQRVSEMQGEDMFLEFPQLADCIEPAQSHASQRETAEALTNMIQRHGRTILRVLKKQIEEHSEKLAGSTLPNDSLLRLVSGPWEQAEPTASPAATPIDESRARISYSPDFSTVVVDGRTFNFVGARARAMGVFIKQWEAGIPELNQHFVLTEAESEASRLRDLLKGSRAWGTLVVRCSKAGFYRLNLD